MKLKVVGLIHGANLTVPLQSGDFVDEGWIGPGLSCSVCLRGGDDICCSFFNDAGALEFQLPDDSCFSSAGCAGEYEPSHGFLLHFQKSILPEIWSVTLGEPARIDKVLFSPSLFPTSKQVNNRRL